MKQDGQLGGKTNWGFSQDDDGDLEDTQSQPTASVHAVEHCFNNTQKIAEYREVEVQRICSSEQAPQKKSARIEEEDSRRL